MRAAVRIRHPHGCSVRVRLASNLASRARIHVFGHLAGVYLADLTFIDDGNPDRIDGLINFSKRRLDYSVIANIQLYQQKPFRFRELPQVREMYELSLELEPRGAERSQIA